MSRSKSPSLRRGKVYRTRDFEQWTANPTRMAKRLVEKGVLRRLRSGLYYRPRTSKFGEVPPTDNELLKKFLGSDHYVITGPTRWNELGLGTTALFSAPLVYNDKRSGEIELGTRRFRMRRIPFPSNPGPEWFTVDLLEHSDEAGANLEEILGNLEMALANGKLEAEILKAMAKKYGTKKTQRLVKLACTSAEKEAS